ncbi:MAG: grkB2 [Clostridiaceae bacterium]|jgi:spore germination protein KB|nr:grkB2 [Clostridiaceae bacterium]
MKIEKGIISSTQLMFLFIGLLQTNTLTAAFISGVTKQNTWVVLLIGFFIVSILLFIYTWLNKKFPDKNLIEINDVIYGKHIGKVFSLLYIYYFWFLVPANLRFIVDFFYTYLFEGTDIGIFVIVIILVCIYTVKKGIEVIARAGFIITVIVIIAAIFISLFTIKDLHLSNFLPLFQINLKELIQGTNLMVCIPFGEIVVFLMFYPYVNETKQVKKAAFTGLILGSIYFLTVILRNIAVLGNIASIHVLPSYQVSRLINVGEIISRTEVLVALTLLFSIFLKLCIFYYAAALSISQFFKLRSYKPLVIPIGIISGILSISMYSASVDEAYNAANIYPIYAIPFIILFPVMSMITAYVRRL